MDENAVDEIIREVDIDAVREIVEEEEEIELVDIELKEEEIELVDIEFKADNAIEEIVEEEEEIIEENSVSPIREVQQIIPTTDDLKLPGLTFRVWFWGCCSVFYSLSST
ncbi:hypothetical protein SLA2020_423990, partial [Shorea laevis]